MSDLTIIAEEEDSCLVCKHRSYCSILKREPEKSKSCIYKVIREMKK